MYSARILLDSIGPSGKRLTTFEVTFPRFILAEVNTHRVLSRNSASSRAIPTEKIIQRVIDEPAMFVWWGANQSGMQSSVELSEERDVCIATAADDCIQYASPKELVQQEWLAARLDAVKHARRMLELGAHKQLVNRLLEPWMIHTAIISATEWNNFFFLRDHFMAQPEFQFVAHLMREAFDSSVPQKLDVWDWHMPLIHPEDYALAEAYLDTLTKEQRLLEAQEAPELLTTAYQWAKHILRKVSAGRCARVSYLTHEGTRDIAKDVQLYERLVEGLKTKQPLHMSPLEHVARALAQPTRVGNFEGWCQLRKLIPGEAGPETLARS